MTLLSKMFDGRISSVFTRGLHTTISQKVVIVSVIASVALLGVLARYLRRRKTPRPIRRNRKIGGRRSRNSIRSPNDLVSLSGSKVSARSQSPGGSIVALSDRLSLASGSLGAGIIQGTPLSPQQLGVMGMEALETVINYWEDALSCYHTPTSHEDSEFCREIQNLLDMAYALQDQSELLFLDQRSVLFRNESHASKKLTRADRSGSDPNFDSAESFASALDQVADLREFEEFFESMSDLHRYPLYQSAIRHLEENPIPFRSMRTELVNCTSDVEYLAKLHCIRLAFQYLFKVGSQAFSKLLPNCNSYTERRNINFLASASTRLENVKIRQICVRHDMKLYKFEDASAGQWVADTGRQILTDLLLLSDKDPKDFLVGYEDMLRFLQDANNWSAIEKELEQRNVKAMTFYDVVLDFIILDAFKDLDSPPTSVTAVVQNRFLSNGFKETALTTAVWSVLKAKRRLLKYSNGFMAHFYIISEQISPLMAWGFFGPDENLRDVCHYFREQTLGFLTDIFNFQKCRYETVEDLSADIFQQMKERVNNITIKFSQ